MKKIRIVVVIPAGPGTRLEFVTDTIRSYAYYSTETYQIILIDDTRAGLGSQIKSLFPDVDIITKRKPSGPMAGLYISLAEAYKYALDNYEFSLLFKLDTDALVISEAPEQAALALFESDPKIGMAGQYPLTYSGKVWDMKFPRDRMVHGTMTWRFIRRPLVNSFLHKLHVKALKNGYRTGESVFGGAYFMSQAFIKAMSDSGLLPKQILGKANLGEDHLFSLIAKALGFELASLSGKDQPFACDWKLLPASPDELFSTGRKIIHSTRGFGDDDEEKVRAFFSRLRDQDSPH